MRRHRISIFFILTFFIFMDFLGAYHDEPQWFRSRFIRGPFLESTYNPAAFGPALMAFILTLIYAGKSRVKSLLGERFEVAVSSIMVAYSLIIVSCYFVVFHCFLESYLGMFCHVLSGFQIPL